MKKNVEYNKYKDDVQAVLSAGHDDDSCAAKLANVVDQAYELGGFNKDLILNDVAIGKERSVYGMRFRDNGSSYTYERTGALASVAANVQPPDDYLPVHNKMRRCILKPDGTVNYYLDADDSMWKEGSSKGEALSVVGVYAPHSEEDAWVQIDGTADAAHIGSCILLEDIAGTRKWYAIIIDVDSDKYILSNPLMISWGLNASNNPCEFAWIGDAKLDGSDGQFMVDVPSFWYKVSDEIDDAGTWRRHDISLRYFPDAKYMPGSFIGATEAVISDVSGKAVDGWTGTWDSQNKVWEDIAYAGLGEKMLSVCGFYPRTYVYRSDVRDKSAAAGASYHQYGFFNNLAVQYLMMIEYADLNTQRAMGDGVVSFAGGGIDWAAYNDSRPIRRTGDTIRAGNKTWDMSTLASLAQMEANGGNVYTIQSLSYRGIENPWGHVWKWVDGINFEWQANDGSTSFAYPFVTDDPDKFSDTLKDHVQLPDRMESAAYEDGDWVRKNRWWKDPSPEMLPTTISASVSSYVGDYAYYPSGSPSAGYLRVLAVGGSASIGSYAGAFYSLSNYGSGNRFANVGGRLCSKK